MKKISYKIALVSIICTLIAGLSVGLMANLYSTRIIKSQAEEILINQAELRAKEIENITAVTEMMIKDANALIREHANTGDLENNLEGFIEDVSPILLNLANNLSYNVDMYMTLDPRYANDGMLVNHIYFKENDVFKLIEAPISVEDVENSPEEYAWFLEPMKQKKGLWSDVYYDSNLGLWMISYTEPITTNQGIIGIVGLDIDFDTLKTIVSEKTLYNTGYLMLIDANHHFVAHPTYSSEDNLSTVANGSLQQLSEIINNDGSGIKYHTLDNEQKIAAFAPVGDAFTVIASVEEREIMHSIFIMQKYLFIIVAGSVIFLSLFGYLGGVMISRPIQKVSRTVEEIGRGDLTTQVNISSKDEIGRLAGDVNEMIKGIKTLVTDVKEASQKIIGSSREIHGVTNQISDSTKTVYTKIEELAHATSEQASSAEQANFKTSDMVESVQAVKNSVDEINNLVNETVMVINESKEIMDRQKGEVTKSMAISSEVVKAMAELSNQSKEIGYILQVISHISEQTNLLSLNATIEAARAGIHGRGFAVVASEIRKLAEQSNNSISDISNIINDIKQSIENALAEMSKGNASQKENIGMITKTISSFNEFSVAVEKIEKEALNVEAVVIDLSKNAVIANDAIVNIAGITEETAAYSQEVVETMDFQNSITGDIVRTTKELNSMSNELFKSIESFKL